VIRQPCCATAVLVFEGGPSHKQAVNGRECRVLGGLLSFFAAATFAFNAVAARRAVLTGTVAQGMAITVGIGAPMFLVVAAATGHLGAIADFSGRTLLLLSVAGVLHFVWGRYCSFRASKAIGANLAGNLQQFDLVVSLVLAIWILGETLTPLKILGITLIVIGSTMRPRDKTSRGRTALPLAEGVDPAAALPSAAGPAKQIAFTPNYVEGTLFSALSWTGYGVSPILIRSAIENSTLGASVAAGLVSYTAGAVAIGLLLLWPGQMRHALAVDRTTLKWFTWSGVAICISQMFRYMALSLAPVTVVQPIQRLSTLFRYVFSWSLNPQHEMFDRRLIFGAAVSVVGAFVLSLSTDLVMSLVSLPDWAVAAARWRWP
jgi:drug/metabolite transporter (DMT)-like permease